MVENFAVIDLGSNSCRMTVTEINDDGSFKRSQMSKQFVRLSEDMGQSGALQQAPMDRTIEALKGFYEEYSQLPNLTLKAVATAAVRNASNQKAFLDRVRSEVHGLNIEVISGTEEAHYDYLGVINTLPVTNCVIMDTGGASCELVLVQNGREQNLVSLPFGSVNLSETFFKHGLDQLAAVDLFRLSTAVQRLFNGLWWLQRGQNLPLVALGGSNRTLAKIRRKQKNVADFEDIHGFRMSVSEVDNVYAEIIEHNLAERKAIPGLSKDRADIIAAGITPIVTIMRFLDAGRVIFSENGVREGILYEHLDQLRAKGKIGNKKDNISNTKKNAGSRKKADKK
ncbi:MAG: Ppx/GppA family phosphatase [Furfurilactobacillus sp.]|uniref:Ppx/GppA family phosphatase n=1 Tax=Furfurilactobacillus sp. TaxID=2767911 RepID=UPI002586B521|nr:Ppx/GppA family phosphatase [Furfurilactobacillus sp.]MCH4011600.1 Ppx/GppA family phosphatase [Furfurilactobacillus sp.]MCH4037492.1 Ppx/GppA family phosphatase [Furfurilactobacillus sp.]MCH4115872.1 Ppx/GppA family phosphatase [Furfurilactobacillus sp.]MCI1339944.1 Ppx/GppA family phosphatase [Furfurilactobacillus sp.]MCI1386908.1 Ppx/GppA family phosphatase [Furfurilactobacillus sp.]